ncbi:MAG: Holliday junction resolvase RuvX [candidate division WOR-3 bacterium]
MGRVLAIDYGKRRVGFAISDPEGRVAFPLETLDAKRGDVFLYLREIYMEKPFETVVIGKPPRKELLYDVNFLACFLKRNFGVNIVFWDEEYTSAEAEEILKGMGIKITKRNKHLIDTLSAYIILCEYLGYKPGITAL